MGAATLDDSKCEEEQGNYKEKTQKLFKIIRVWVIRYEFLKVSPWQGPVREFGLCNVFNEGLYAVVFIEYLSYQE